MKRIFAALTAACLLAALVTGCGGQDTSSAGTADSAAEQQPAAQQEQNDQQEQQEQPQQEQTGTVLSADWGTTSVNPLTGRQQDYPDQRPVAVMVNSEGSMFGQWGVSRADVMIEAVTTGRTTGMLCLYPSVDSVGKVGPVAAGDDLFLQLALPLNAIPVQIDKTIYASNLLNLLSYQDLDGVYTGVTCFDFDKERGVDATNEYCWYTTPDLLRDGLALYGLSSSGGTRTLFQFGTEAAGLPIPEGAEFSALQLNLVYSDECVVTLNYDGGNGVYVRSDASGAVQTDADTGSAVSFENVLVLYTATGVKDDARTRDYDLASGGSGIYLAKGGWKEIRWTKGDALDPLRLYDTDGNELTVDPGRSYIGIIGGFDSQRVVLYDSNWAEQSLPG